MRRWAHYSFGGWREVCKPNCKPTARHSMALRITSQNHRLRNGVPDHTLRYRPTHANMRIIELENRCTGNRTVGSNPTLSTT
jgi:hypothetical protein